MTYQEDDFIAAEPVTTQISEDGVHFTPVDSRPMLDPSEEKTLAGLAHLSIFLNLFTGFLGLLPPLVIYLAYRDRSKYVAYQSLQALIFQGVFFFGAGLLAAIVLVLSGILVIVLVGLCGIPIGLLLALVPIGALIYAIVAAVDSFQHRDFKYWLIGDWVRGTFEN